MGDLAGRGLRQVTESPCCGGSLRARPHSSPFRDGRILDDGKESSGAGEWRGGRGMAVHHDIAPALLRWAVEGAGWDEQAALRRFPK